MIGRCPKCLNTNLTVTSLEEEYLPGHTLDTVKVSWWCPRCEQPLNANLDVSMNGGNTPAYMRSMDESRRDVRPHTTRYP